MTVEEWLVATELWPMMAQVFSADSRRLRRLEVAEHLLDHRKFLLFSCATYWPIRTNVPQPLSYIAVEIAERAADGIIQSEDFELAEAEARERISPHEPRYPLYRREWFLSSTPLQIARYASHLVFNYSPLGLFCQATGYDHVLTSASPVPSPIPMQWHIGLLRCIFGNPFRPIVADPAWLTPTVQAIAAAIYQDRAFDRLPILADALEEAGCTNADVLLHCRQPGEHVRGCWVVDLVLGKK